MKLTDELYGQLVQAIFETMSPDECTYVDTEFELTDGSGKLIGFEVHGWYNWSVDHEYDVNAYDTIEADVDIHSIDAFDPSIGDCPIIEMSGIDLSVFNRDLSNLLKVA